MKEAQNDSTDSGRQDMSGAGNAQFIKNPLPGPTPHEKRGGLDYDYEVSEDKMHYDIEKPSRNFYDY